MKKVLLPLLLLIAAFYSGSGQETCSVQRKSAKNVHYSYVSLATPLFYCRLDPVIQKDEMFTCCVLMIIYF